MRCLRGIQSAFCGWVLVTAMLATATSGMAAATHYNGDKPDEKDSAKKSDRADEKDAETEEKPTSAKAEIDQFWEKLSKFTAGAIQKDKPLNDPNQATVLKQAVSDREKFPDAESLKKIEEEFTEQKRSIEEALGSETKEVPEIAQLDKVIASIQAEQLAREQATLKTEAREAMAGKGSPAEVQQKVEKWLEQAQQLQEKSGDKISALFGLDNKIRAMTSTNRGLQSEPAQPKTNSTVSPVPETNPKSNLSQATEPNLAHRSEPVPDSDASNKSPESPPSSSPGVESSSTSSPGSITEERSSGADSASPTVSDGATTPTARTDSPTSSSAAAPNTLPGFDKFLGNDSSQTTPEPNGVNSGPSLAANSPPSSATAGSSQQASSPSNSGPTASASTQQSGTGDSTNPCSECEKREQLRASRFSHANGQEQNGSASASSGSATGSRGNLFGSSTAPGPSGGSFFDTSRGDILSAAASSAERSGNNNATDTNASGVQGGVASGGSTNVPDENSVRVRLGQGAAKGPSDLAQEGNGFVRLQKPEVPSGYSSSNFQTGSVFDLPGIISAKDRIRSVAISMNRAGNDPSGNASGSTENGSGTSGWASATAQDNAATDQRRGFNSSDASSSSPGDFDDEEGEGAAAAASQRRTLAKRANRIPASTPIRMAVLPKSTGGRGFANSLSNDPVELDGLVLAEPEPLKAPALIDGPTQTAVATKKANDLRKIDGSLDTLAKLLSKAQSSLRGPGARGSALQRFQISLLPTAK